MQTPRRAPAAPSSAAASGIDEPTDEDRPAASPAAIGGPGNNSGVTGRVVVRPVDVIVIHPGSRYLRIGLATDSVPLTLPHCVARRTHFGVCDRRLPPPRLLPPITANKETIAAVDEKVKELSALLSSCLTSKGVQRFAAEPSRPLKVGTVSFEMSLARRLDDGATSALTGDPICAGNSSHYMEPATDVQAVFGYDALRLQPNSGFELRWPVWRGRLNVHADVGGSLSAVLADLTDIWRYAISQRLGTNSAIGASSSMAERSAILVVGDVYVAEHVKRMLDVLFDELGFGRVFVHVESVCAAFGAGAATACVVDVGESKTLVACVDDGMSLKQTRLLMEFGGGDITRIAQHLFKVTEQNIYI